MKKINYSKIYSEISQDLSEKELNIISKRFGIIGKKTQTLEAIGKKIGITRERVRQIISRAFFVMKKNNKGKIKEVFNCFEDYFKKSGNFKKESIALSDLGKKENQPYVLFFLNLGDSFSRAYEKENFFSFWMTDTKSVEKIKKITSVFKKELEEKKKPQKKEDFIAEMSSKYKIDKKEVISLIEVSKEIGENKEGEIGLSKWAEINPKGVKDKSYLILQKESKPLHFREVAQLIGQRGYSLKKKALPQTVHNELIKDSRFVLVGKGTYALREWGYVPGTVKEVITRVIKESRESLTEKQIVEKVLEQRFVAKNTVLINLHNHRLFKENNKDKRYKLKDVQTA